MMYEIYSGKQYIPLYSVRKVLSDHDLFEIVEHHCSEEATERFGDCLSDLPEYPVERLIDRLNQELKELKLLIQVEDLVRKEPDQYVWTCLIG